MICLNIQGASSIEHIMNMYSDTSVCMGGGEGGSSPVRRSRNINLYIDFAINPTQGLQYIRHLGTAIQFYQQIM